MTPLKVTLHIPFEQTFEISNDAKLNWQRTLKLLNIEFGEETKDV